MHRIFSIEQVRGRTGGRSGADGAPQPLRGRVRVTMEDGEGFAISSSKAARLGLADGKELPEETYDGIMQSLRSDCMQRCGRLLGSRDYSEKRLREKLGEAGYPAFVREEAIGRLRKAGYLDDRRYARSYVRNHMQDRSRRRITRDLTGRGISETDIEEAFAAVGGEEIEEAQRDQVLRLLKKRGFDPAEAAFEERQKIMAFLHRKGYPADLIRRMTGGGDRRN